MCYIEMSRYEILQMVFCIDCICWPHLKSVPPPVSIYKRVIAWQKVIVPSFKRISLNIYTQTFNVALNGSEDFASLTNS